ncbi:MAG: hypothetical protein NTV46_03105 [Verrucomicrobia bacterium]|nr:hypothetical protein [Verrucomicrobiota bacterium]
MLDNDNNVPHEELSASPHAADPLSAPMRRDICVSDRTSGAAGRIDIVLHH